MSKSLDMRFHWLRDRVDQGQFRVLFAPGLKNLADVFYQGPPRRPPQSACPFLRRR
jgi:hypothetical protein